MNQLNIHKSWLNGILPPLPESVKSILSDSTKPFYPKPEHVFRSFEEPFNKTSLVIIGQDPYINLCEGLNDTQVPQAVGLAFSIPKTCKKLPPSLKIIFKVAKINPLKRENRGDISNWTKQGVLLLNAALTVEPGKSNSHASAWSKWSDNLIKNMSTRSKKPLVFLLWGEFAKKKVKFLDKTKHRIITTSHPSHLSAYRGFLASNCFEKANEVLKAIGQEPILWS